MNKFESTYKKFAKTEPYKVACSECKILFYKADDDPFVCLECSAMSDSPTLYLRGGGAKRVQ